MENMNYTICPKCNNQVIFGSTFCSSCGHRFENKTRICPSCNNSISADNLFCTNCGYKFKTENVQFCTECGNALSGADLFCTKCGAKVSPTNQANVEVKSQIVQPTPVYQPIPAYQPSVPVQKDNKKEIIPILCAVIVLLVAAIIAIVLVKNKDKPSVLPNSTTETESNDTTATINTTANATTADKTTVAPIHTNPPYNNEGWAEAYVNTKRDDLNLRNSAYDGDIIDTMPKDSTLYVLDYGAKYNNFYYVCFDGIYGYASCDFVKLYSGQTPDNVSFPDYIGKFYSKYCEDMDYKWEYYDYIRIRKDKIILCINYLEGLAYAEATYNVSPDGKTLTLGTVYYTNGVMALSAGATIEYLGNDVLQVYGFEAYSYEFMIPISPAYESGLIFYR
jgi:hypothetical protein